MNTTKIAQYAALAAKSSCLAAFVKILIAAEKSNVNTIKTPTALIVSLELACADEPPDSSGFDVLAVRWYITKTGITSNMKITKVTITFMSWSMRELE
jgi:hypothetical protein